MRLYAYWRSSCSYRARIGLNLKGLAYDIEPVHLRNLEQSSEAFSEKNPSQQVPVLELDDGTRIGQSIAILEYLDEVHSGAPLLPDEPVARARVRQLAEVINSGVQPLQNFHVLGKIKQDFDADRKAWSVHFIARGLKAYDELAAPYAGDFSVGDSPTIADIVLVPQLYNARRFGMDVEAELPRLAEIDARCRELEAFARAHPDQQPDAETE